MFGATAEGFTVQGGVAPGFEEVEREFRKNFARRRELGAACAIYHRGEKVVDLWGGYRDFKSRAPWEEDTLVLVYSTTKGVAAMTMAVAHSRGLLDYDEKVATYWPEFAQEGKENITVRQLLAHQAGVCVVDQLLDLDILSDSDGLAEILARQKTLWEAGANHGYHHFCLGLYQSEIIRRVDPQHRSLGRYFQEEIAEPLGLEFYIGLPPDIPDSRLAIVESTRPSDFLHHLAEVPWRFTLALLFPRTMTARTMSNPPMLSGKATDFSRRDALAVEMASANGIGQVRSIAKLYGAFATGGAELDLEQETLDELTAPAVNPTSGLHDGVLLDDTSYSLGFRKPSPAFEFGSNGRSFGIGGIGGSFGFADPDAQVGYAYGMTRPGFQIFDDPRAKALRDALYRCLEKL
jgi:CubicO group peptidase (beta-lactamase class C family)